MNMKATGAADALTLPSAGAETAGFRLPESVELVTVQRLASKEEYQ